MTEYEHAEISRALALAIGWKPEQLFNDHDESYCSIIISKGNWITRHKTFDYRDPAVIWPIAERFDCFPSFEGIEWRAWSTVPHFADTAAKAVAIAAIASASKGEQG